MENSLEGVCVSGGEGGGGIIHIYSSVEHHFQSVHMKWNTYTAFTIQSQNPQEIHYTKPTYTMYVWQHLHTYQTKFLNY